MGSKVTAEPAVRVLLGFTSLRLEAGETITTTVEASTRPLQYWTGGGLIGTTSPISVEAASFSGDPDALSVIVNFED